MPPAAVERIYLDHAATTPLDPAVHEAMAPYLTDAYGNPSSLHAWGRAARKALQSARNTVAQCLGGDPEGWVFTSCGTEANNLAVVGWAQALQAQGRHLVISAIEHSAVRNPAKFLAQMGWEVTVLPVDAEGVVSLADLEAALRPDTVLVSVMHGNNEMGSIQPIEAIGTLLRERGVCFHTDAVQTAGKLPIDLSSLPVDALSLSAHKFYGPKGVGALYVTPKAPRPTALLFGGGQEQQLRSGTEHVAGIVGLAAALSLSESHREAETVRLRALQQQLIDGVRGVYPGAILNGPADVDRRVPGNVNLSFPPLEGESIVLSLDMKGVAVSSGSACHSGKVEPSPIVMALGQSSVVAKSTIRFSMGRQTTPEQIDRVVGLVGDVTQRLQPATAPAQ